MPALLRPGQVVTVPLSAEGEELTVRLWLEGDALHLGVSLPGQLVDPRAAGPCHVPAGTPQGGQFTPCEGAGGGPQPAHAPGKPDPNGPAAHPVSPGGWSFAEGKVTAAAGVPPRKPTFGQSAAPEEVQGVKDMLAAIPDHRVQALQRGDLSALHPPGPAATLKAQVGGATPEWRQGLAADVKWLGGLLADRPWRKIDQKEGQAALEFKVAGVPGKRSVYNNPAVGGENYIHVNANPGREHDFAHEAGHMIEDNDRAVHRACLAFLELRAGGETVRPINDFIGFRAYSQDERGRKDDFAKAFGSENRGAYCGKDYGGRGTEILSMGLEELHKDPQKFALRDPQYCKFVLACLHGQVK